jgi:hypothetical protein
MVVKPVVKRPVGKPKGSPRPPGSGRKAGTPNRVVREIKLIAQEHGPDIVDELKRIALRGKSEADRIAAGRVVLERGYGKAASPIHLSGAEGGPLSLSIFLGATPEQFRIFLRSLTTEDVVTFLKLMTDDNLKLVGDKLGVVLVAQDAAHEAEMARMRKILNHEPLDS